MGGHLIDPHHKPHGLQLSLNGAPTHCIPPGAPQNLPSHHIELLYAAAVYGTPGIAMRPEELARLEQGLGPEGRISALERYAYLLPGISPDRTTSLQHPSHLHPTQPMAPIASPSPPSAATQEPFVAPPPSPPPTLMSARALEKRRATDDSSTTHAMVSGPSSSTHPPVAGGPELPQPKFPHTESSRVLGKRKYTEPDDGTSAWLPLFPSPSHKSRGGEARHPSRPAKYRQHMLKAHFPGVDAVYAVRERQQCPWSGCAGSRRGDCGNLTLALKHVRDVYFRLRDAPYPHCGEMKRYDSLGTCEEMSDSDAWGRGGGARSRCPLARKAIRVCSIQVARTPDEDGPLAFSEPRPRELALYRCGLKTTLRNP
ncbi:hypothetical protein C8Q77DRAFT_1270869 [Trametes polyzona]|nr:hypothetical protein C8Q77DRAFT_1270869 [Trametes polyzona]